MSISLRESKASRMGESAGTEKKKKRQLLLLIGLGGQTQIKTTAKLTGDIVSPKVMQQL